MRGLGEGGGTVFSTGYSAEGAVAGGSADTPETYLGQGNEKVSEAV